MATYFKIPAEKVPVGVRFDIRADCQGQTIEIAYGGFRRGEHEEGDDYRRVWDRSEGGPENARYYRRAGVR